MLALKHVLRAGSRNARSDTDQNPRVGDLREARPEAVLLSAVFLEFCVLGRVFFGVTLLLVFFVLPRQVLAKAKRTFASVTHLSPPIPRRKK